MAATTTTIAERHDLQRGDLCEIRVLPRMEWDEESVAYGEYRFTGPNEELQFDRGDVSPPLVLSHLRIRSVQKVTPEHVAKQFHVGQRVAVNKYGGTYRAEVTKVGRTRVTLSFRTHGGKDKTTTVPAWQVVV